MKSRSSFVKYMYPAPIPNRNKFPLPRKHEPDTLFLYPFQRLGLLSALRQVFKLLLETGIKTGLLETLTVCVLQVRVSALDHPSGRALHVALRMVPRLLRHSLHLRISQLNVLKISIYLAPAYSYATRLCCLLRHVSSFFLSSYSNIYYNYNLLLGSQC